MYIVRPTLYCSSLIKSSLVHAFHTYCEGYFLCECKLFLQEAGKFYTFS